MSEPAPTPDRRVPFWRRPRRISRQIAGTLVATALVAVALFGALNYVAADRLLRAGGFEQLAGVAASRARTIELGTGRLLASTSSIANDVSLARAVTDFTAGLEALEEVPLTAGQRDELERWYTENLVDPLNETGLLPEPITLDGVLPRTTAGQLLQYHLVLDDTEPLPDDTAYAEALAEHDSNLRAIAESFGYIDLLLVSSDNRIVYSTDTRIDLGTSLVDGPYSDSVLSSMVIDELPRARAGGSLLTDFALYLPNRADPTLFAGARVRDGSRIAGSIVAEIPNESLDLITTANGEWDEVGLDDGESYVVSSDLVLQSQSRPWIEDPEGYLDDVGDEEMRNAITTLGSPVGVQIVDTEAVRAARRGDEFEGRTDNYLGRSVYSASTNIDVPGVGWVVVTEVPIRDARAPLTEYLLDLAIVVLIITPIAAIVGLLLARRLSRPIGPAVAAATAVAGGERDLDLPELGNDEFGDLGRRLSRMADTLKLQEQELEAEFEHKRQLMLAVLPPHLVDDAGSVTGRGERRDVATVVSIGIDSGLAAEGEDDLTAQLSATANVVEDLAKRYEVERIRVAADRYLYICGAGRTDDGSRGATEFARELWLALREAARERGLELTMHIGISTGPVGTGVLERGSLTFGAWGEPVRRALAISALSRADEILLDETTADLLGSTIEVRPVVDMVDLDQEPMRLSSLVVATTPG